MFYILVVAYQPACKGSQEAATGLREALAADA